MSNWSIVGIIGIITVVCCLIVARVTGNKRGVCLGGVGALLSAGGFGYGIAFLVRKGLTGSYLIVAVLVGIIIPVLIFLTLYSLVKEAATGGKELPNSLDKQKAELEKEKTNLQEEKDNQRLAMEEKHSKAIKAVEEEHNKTIKAVEEKYGRTIRAVEDEHSKTIQAMEEEKVVLVDALVKAKSKLDQVKAELEEEKLSGQETMDLEQKEREFAEEKETLLQKINNLNECINKLEEEKAESGSNVHKLHSHIDRLEEEFEKEKEEYNRKLQNLHNHINKLEEEKAEHSNYVQGLNDSLSRLENEKAQWHSDVNDLNECLTELLGEHERYEAEKNDITKGFINERESLLKKHQDELQKLADELTIERERARTSLEKMQELEQSYRQKEIEEEMRRQEAAHIRSRTDKKFDYEHVIEKGKMLQKKGLYQLAITLYEERYNKVKDENEKNLLRKEIASCYLDAGEPGKAKRLLAKG